MSETHVDLSDLCRSCGLCCTGMMFSHAKVDAEDKSLLARIAPDSLDKVVSGERLNLPCHFLSGTMCSIYEQGRPKVCGEFLCALAKNVDRADVPMNKALVIISQALRLLDDVRSGIPTATSLSQSAAIVLSGEKPETVALADFQKARLSYLALQIMIDKHFRTEGDQLIDTKPAKPD